jgi:hypothetical protein
MATTSLPARIRGFFGQNDPSTTGANLGYTPTPNEPGPPRIGAAMFGQSGRANYWGLPQWDEINAKLIGPAGQYVFDQMYRSDPDIRRLVLMVSTPILSGSWKLEAYGGDDATDQDREIAETIWWGLNNYMSPNFTEHLAEALPLMIRAGFAPFEQVWGTCEYKGKTLSFPSSLQMRLPRSIWRWWQDEFGAMTYIGQIIPNKPTVVIPASELVYYRLGAEGDNWMGVSMLRGAYKPWMYKDKLERIDAIGQERKAVGVPVIYPPQSMDAQTRTQVETIFASLHTNEVGYVVMPGPKAGTTGSQGGNNEWLVDVIQFDSSSGDSIQASLTYHKLAISGSVLGDFMELGHHQVGAKATADVQMDPFVTAEMAFAETGPKPPLNDLVDRIRKANWPDAAGSPTLDVSLTDESSLSELATFASLLISEGAMQVDPELEDFFRQRAGLPPANADVRKLTVAAQQTELENKANPPQPIIVSPTSQSPPTQGKPQPGAPGSQPQQQPASQGNAKPQTPGKQLDTPTVKWWEQLLSQDKLKQALDGARQSVETAAGSKAQGVALQIAAGQDPDVQGLSDALTDEYTRLYKLGVGTVQDELAKQRPAQLMSPVDVIAGLGARIKRARQRGDHSADSVAQAVSTKLRQADIAGLKDGHDRTALAVQTAVQQLHSEALQNASASINDGRWDVGSTAPDVVGCIYTSVLDGNTCDECESADTGDVLTLDQASDLGPPNPDCAGGDRCRCQLVYITSNDPAAG